MRRTEEESLEKCKGIVQKIMMAMAKQKNVSMDVKNGTAQLDELLDVINNFIVKKLEKAETSKQMHHDPRVNNFKATRDNPCADREMKIAASGKSFA